MLDHLNERRSRRVGTFPVIECEGAEGNVGNNLIETPEEFLEFLFSTVLSVERRVRSTVASDKNTMVEDLQKSGSTLETLDK